MILTINQAYNIAQAMLTDSASTIVANKINCGTVYTVRKDGLALYIYAPYGTKKTRVCNNSYGAVSLDEDKRRVFDAYTKTNVARAISSSKYTPGAVLTRVLSPKYFHLLEMAQSRISGCLKTQDNTLKLHRCMTDIKTR
jgi:hypothetical protein